MRQWMILASAMIFVQAAAFAQTALPVSNPGFEAAPVANGSFVVGASGWTTISQISGSSAV